MEIVTIPMLRDNYSYLLIAEDERAAIIDPTEAEPAVHEIERRNLSLRFILNTHHHGDHTGGNAELKRRYGCKTAAPAADLHRIADVDIPLREGDVFSFGGDAAKIIETPGHTSGHICFYFKAAKALFCGDTLFSLGCGRLFEGTAEQMWRSLSKIMALPDGTLVYCGHEYTEANGRFCLNVEPDNTALQRRMAEVVKLRAAGRPTIPATLGEEKHANAFLRAGNAERFAALRARKDGF